MTLCVVVALLSALYIYINITVVGIALFAVYSSLLLLLYRRRPKFVAFASVQTRDPEELAVSRNFPIRYTDNFEINEVYWIDIVCFIEDVTIVALHNCMETLLKKVYFTPRPSPCPLYLYRPTLVVRRSFSILSTFLSLSCFIS